MKSKIIFNKQFFTLLILFSILVGCDSSQSQKIGELPAVSKHLDQSSINEGDVSLEEIEAVMNHIKEQPEAEEMTLESVREISTAGVNLEDVNQDELLNEAIRLVVIHQQGSISLLQRRLKVGYSRAARLIDEMEKIAVVAPFTGSKAREVLVDESYLDNIFNE